MSRDEPVSQTAPTPSTARRSPDEILDDLRRLRVDLRADHPDMTEADWEELADRLAAGVDDGLRAHVHGSRDEAT